LLLSLSFEAAPEEGGGICFYFGGAYLKERVPSLEGKEGGTGPIPIHEKRNSAVPGGRRLKFGEFPLAEPECRRSEEERNTLRSDSLKSRTSRGKTRKEEKVGLTLNTLCTQLVQENTSLSGKNLSLQRHLLSGGKGCQNASRSQKEQQTPKTTKLLARSRGGDGKEK